MKYYKVTYRFVDKGQGKMGNFKVFAENEQKAYTKAHELLAKEGKKMVGIRNIDGPHDDDQPLALETDFDFLT